MVERNLADPDWEPSDEDFNELLRHVGDDIRAVQGEVQRNLDAALTAARIQGARDAAE
jgi:hypothetical protein